MTASVDDRILVLGEGWFPDTRGGVARVVAELHAALRPAHDVRTLVVGPVTRQAAGVRVAADPGDRLVHRIASAARAASQEARSASVIDAHFALYAFLPLLARRFARAGFVCHFHGPWSDESRSAGEGLPRVLAKRAVERFVYRRADRLIVHSHAFERVLVERFDIGPWNIDVVPPGVDLKRFSPGDRCRARLGLGLPESAFVVASVRRLVPRMGLDVLLDSCARLPH